MSIDKQLIQNPYNNFSMIFFQGMNYTYFFYVILIRFTFRFLHQCCHMLSTAEVHDVETTSPACFGKLVRDMSKTQGAGGGMGGGGGRLLVRGTKP